jgi:2-octaprenyl-6-methoxyphenol hydroxylase
MKPDVIILGGGPNGLAAALALGSNRLMHPLNVLLLDAREPTTVPDDSRGTAITQSTQAMLSVLGVWDTLKPNACEMRDVIVTDDTGTHQGRVPLLSLATRGEDKAAASMVENRALAAALVDAVQNSPAITLRGGFAFDRAETTSGRITLHAKNNDTASAPVLIAADGRHSPVRTQAGIKITTHDYHQTALSFAITHSLPHDMMAEEHFSPDGVFAVLPLAGDASSIVWGTSPDDATRLMALDEEAFNDALQARMGDRLGIVKLRGKRGAYPLVMQLAENFGAPRIALLGDAAHAIHPLAGLGLNLGFKDAAALADVFFEAQARGEDIGSLQVLERYQQARRFDTVMTSFAMDGMNGLFVNDNPVLKTLRTQGLRLIDQLPRAKQFFMTQAAGRSQDHPKLLQGLLPG